MARLVVGMYDDREDARDTVQDLVDAGFPRDRISMVAPKREGEDIPPMRAERRGGVEADDVAAGAGIGAALGGLGGLLVGLGALTIPGIGPVIAAGTLGSTLIGAGIGAAAGGLTGALVSAGVPEEEAEYYAEGVRRGATLVTIETRDERANEAVNIMQRHNPVNIDRRAERWQQTGWRGFDREARPFTADQVERERMQITEGERFTVPIVEEDVDIGKRTVEKGGVQVHKWVEERPVEETVRLREEDIDVQRRRVDRPATEEDMRAFEEETYTVRTQREEPVVSKTTRVTGEVEVGKRVEEREQTVRGTERRTEVDVSRTDVDWDTYDRDFRRHFDRTMTGANMNYEQARPAYQYGYQWAMRSEYRNRDWNDIETDLRREWDRTRPINADWRTAREAVHEGWNAARRNV